MNKSRYRNLQDSLSFEDVFSVVIAIVSATVFSVVGPQARAADDTPKAADEKPKASEEKAEQPVDPKNPGKPAATPWPRRFPFPELILEAPEGGQAATPARKATWNPAASRFTVVAVLASWNGASAPLAAWLSDLNDVLEPRKVRVMGAFSNDTDASVVRFLARERPRFETGLAPFSFLKDLGNPKVPTVWVLNTYGEIVARKEIPNETEKKRLRDQLLRWTEF